MTEQQARDFLEEFRNMKATDHFLARFASHVPLPVSRPELYEKATRAKIVLGIHELQRPLDEVRRVHPGMSLEYYNNKRKQLGIG